MLRTVTVNSGNVIPKHFSGHESVTVDTYTGSREWTGFEEGQHRVCRDEDTDPIAL